ncbi:MAG: multiheme c-type cytochrome, partial [Vicinamibacteria bacterium]
MSVLILVQFAVFLILAAMLAARSSRRRAWGLAALLVTVTVTLTMAWKTETDRRVEARERLEESVPYLGRGAEGFVSSQVCRACHPDQYASWYASYHRTMTTVATPETVKGKFDDISLESRGRTYHLERRGDEFWVDMVDLDWERGFRLNGVDPDQFAEKPRVTRQIVMTTGSHHMQTYWVPSRFGREVYNFPFVYLFEQDRWIPREDVFLRPPNAGRFFALWNNSCIDCHSTAGKVGFDFDDELFDSQVAEMGIACEACHGPAEAHVVANRDPLRRYLHHLTDKVDATIVNPDRLSHRASSQVCGQCHGVSVS